MRTLALAAIVAMLALAPLAVGKPTPRIVVVTGNDAPSTVTSATWAFEFRDEPFTLLNVTFEGDRVFENVSFELDLREFVVNGAQLRAYPTDPITPEVAMFQFEDTPSGVMRVGYPGDPVHPGDPVFPTGPIHVLLAAGTTLAGEGTSFTLTTAEHTFALRFSEPPTVVGSAFDFRGAMHVRLVRGP